MTTTRRSFRRGLALAAMPLCILLVSTAPAQEAPLDGGDRIAILFDIGMQPLDHNRLKERAAP